MLQSILLKDNGNQEPLFWPLNPDSYWHDKNGIRSLQSMMESEHQLKAEWSSVSSINTTYLLSSDNSEQLSGMQSFSGRKASAPGVGSMPSCRVRDFVHPSSEGTQNWTNIYEGCRTEAGSVEMFDGSEKIKNMQCFKHDLIYTSCGHAIELKVKGNLSLGLGGSECSVSCIRISSVGSSECVNPGNVGWKLTTGESFYDIPYLLIGCFESGEDSIEMLLGMKKFDGMEGIGALSNEMIPSPSDSGQKRNILLQC